MFNSHLLLDKDCYIGNNYMVIVLELVAKMFLTDKSLINSF